MFYKDHLICMIRLVKYPVHNYCTWYRELGLKMCECEINKVTLLSISASLPPQSPPFYPRLYIESTGPLSYTFLYAVMTAVIFSNKIAVSVQLSRLCSIDRLPMPVKGKLRHPHTSVCRRHVYRYRPKLKHIKRGIETKNVKLFYFSS